jgi:bifunctional DNA-binding transcriptional regulator/antitoxin component of YhaV-PrlF toxin-antitoxin module
MAKVTSKLQLTVPKVIANQYGIKPGDELQWIPAGDAIRVIPQSSRGAPPNARSVAERLILFHKMVERQRRREKSSEKISEPTGRRPKPHEIERGWRREDLYTRGRPR